MKKAILAVAFVVAMFVGVQITPAQDGSYRDREYRDRINQERVYEGQSDGRRSQDMCRFVTVRDEYRYVRHGNVVYKETYSSMYFKKRLVNRELTRRERVDYYNNVRDRYKFNVYLRF